VVCGWFMVFNTTFNNISVVSWWSVLVEETGENHRPVIFDVWFLNVDNKWTVL
jgi:hypothetical protein